MKHETGCYFKWLFLSLTAVLGFPLDSSFLTMVDLGKNKTGMLSTSNIPRRALLQSGSCPISSMIMSNGLCSCAPGQYYVTPAHFTSTCSQYSVSAIASGLSTWDRCINSWADPELTNQWLPYQTNSKSWIAPAIVGEYAILNLTAVSYFDGIAVRGADNGWLVSGFTLMVSNDSSTWSSVNNGQVFSYFTSSPMNSGATYISFGNGLSAMFVKLIVQSWYGSYPCIAYDMLYNTLGCVTCPANSYCYNNVSFACPSNSISGAGSSSFSQCGCNSGQYKYSKNVTIPTTSAMSVLTSSGSAWQNLGATVFGIPTTAYAGASFNLNSNDNFFFLF